MKTRSILSNTFFALPQPINLLLYLIPSVYPLFFLERNLLPDLKISLFCAHVVTNICELA